MDYKYDVFLSYLRSPPSGTWVTNHFLRYFPDALANALGGRRPRIFVDQDQIYSGQKWESRIKNALGHSRCLLGIWSPQYFQSKWCSSECEVMRFRQEKLGLGTPEKPTGLIVGAKVNDGIHFPEFARATQQTNFDAYFYDVPGFTQSPKYLEFVDRVRELALDTAKVVTDAPDWLPEWTGPEWIDDVIARVANPQQPKVEQPLIA